MAFYDLMSTYHPSFSASAADTVLSALDGTLIVSLAKLRHVLHIQLFHVRTR